MKEKELSIGHNCLCFPPIKEPLKRGRDFKDLLQGKFNITYCIIYLVKFVICKKKIPWPALEK